MTEENKLLNAVVGAEQEHWNCENDNDLEDSYSVNSVRHISSKPQTYYTSNVSNTFIRNAATGVMYPFKVGSNESRQLFKIVDTTGLYDVNGKRIIPPRQRANNGVASSSLLQTNPNPNHLYYDSPEEYARHFSTKQRVNVNLNPDFVKGWHERRKTRLSVE
jgi:hypothetical protein